MTKMSKRSQALSPWQKLLSCHKLISFSMYIVGIAWFVGLSTNDLNHGTYLSENALLPGMVEEQFNEDIYANNAFKKATELFEKNDDLAMRKWLYDEMKLSGLNVAIQNFTLNFPDLLGEHIVSGSNVYGVVRSPGTSRTESILLCAPIRLKSSPETATTGSLGVLLSLARFFRKKTYLAKDIIFLFTEMEYVGMQAWLDAYHGTQTSPYLVLSELPVRSGSLQAGLSLEMEGNSFRWLDARLAGLNGILPNLDLLNLAVRLAGKHDTQIRIHGKRDAGPGTSVFKRRQALSTLGTMMYAQSTGSPSGLHGLLLSYQVPALTLASTTSGSSQRTKSIGALAKILEGIFRSLNGLQERFHQSFFFYLLPQTTRYISIGVYMLPFGLIVGGVVIQALALWTEFSREESERMKEKRDKEVEGRKETKETTSKSGDSATSKDPVRTPWWELVPFLLITGVLCVAAGSGGSYFVRVSRPFRIDPGSGLMGGCGALFSGAMALPWLMKRKTKHGVLVSEWRLMKCIALLALGLLLGCLGVLNISMATVLAIPMVPVALLVRPVKNILGSLLLKLALIAVSPLSLIVIGCFLHHYLTNGNAEAAVFASTTCLQHSLLQCWVERELLGSWTFGIATQMVFPTWLLFWGLVWSQ